MNAKQQTNTETNLIVAVAQTNAVPNQKSKTCRRTHQIYQTFRWVLWHLKSRHTVIEFYTPQAIGWTSQDETKATPKKKTKTIQEQNGVYVSRAVESRKHFGINKAL